MAEFYQVDEIKKGIYRITSEEAVFSDLFVGEKKALLWDTGHGFGNLKEKVKSITGLPLYIVNSHGHVDHTCGNYQFEEEVFIHSSDMELCRKHNSYEMRKGEVDARRGGILPEYFDEEKYLNGGTGRLVPVKEGDIFDLGGITLEVIEVPGHTAGSISLLYREEKMLYAGDAMNQHLWLFLPESLPVSVYIETLKKAAAVDFEKLLVSHSQILFDKAILNDFMDLALHLDYEHGRPYTAIPGLEARLCIRKGYVEEDYEKPGYASIAISDRCRF